MPGGDPPDTPWLRACIHCRICLWKNFEYRSILDMKLWQKAPCLHQNPPIWDPKSLGAGVPPQLLILLEPPPFGYHISFVGNDPCKKARSQNIGLSPSGVNKVPVIIRWVYCWRQLEYWPWSNDARRGAVWTTEYVWRLIASCFCTSSLLRFRRRVHLPSLAA